MEPTSADQLFNTEKFCHDAPSKTTTVQSAKPLYQTGSMSLWIHHNLDTHTHVSRLWFMEDLKCLHVNINTAGSNWNPVPH